MHYVCVQTANEDIHVCGNAQIILRCLQNAGLSLTRALGYVTLRFFKCWYFDPQEFESRVSPTHLLTSDSSENSCGHFFSNIVTQSGLIISMLTSRFWNIVFLTLKSL
jgi:hypothetical protein